MATLLQIKSSLFGDDGNTSQLANQFVSDWQAAHPDGTVIVRDLSQDPVAHLDASHVGAFFTPDADRSDAQRAIVAQSDALIAEVQQADLLVIGAPMYNFGIPTQLKSWFDQLARAGVTFNYTAQGPVGLLGEKPVLIFSARGGFYVDTGNDHQAPFLKQFLGLIGLKDVTMIYAEGVNLGDDKKAAALATATQQARQLIEQDTAAA